MVGGWSRATHRSGETVEGKEHLLLCPWEAHWLNLQLPSDWLPRGQDGPVNWLLWVKPCAIRRGLTQASQCHVLIFTELELSKLHSQ